MRVIRSASRNVFSNLALEEWLLVNRDLCKERILYIYENSPSNPWLECDVTGCTSQNIHVVRRHSGGGTVYHDFGNTNVSFLTSREEYSRRDNLQLIVRALKRRFGVTVDVSPRDDLLVHNKYKVSGSAARITRHGCYHHLTLLVDIDTSKIGHILTSKLQGVASNATKSVRSAVGTLSLLHHGLTHNKVADAIADEFLSAGDTNRTQIHSESSTTVDPTDEAQFSGVVDKSSLLQSWEWTFGKTPPFTITRQETFPIGHMQLQLQCVHGRIARVSLNCQALTDHETSVISQVLTGKRFWVSDIRDALNIAARHLHSGRNEMIVPVCDWIVQCIK